MLDETATHIALHSDRAFRYCSTSADRGADTPDLEPPVVLQDDAHDTDERNPNALEATLHASTPLTSNRIIAVAAGKGGVGKTWFSISLSHALALQHRNVLLFDADLRLANVDVQLGLNPAHDIADVLTGQHTLKDVALAYGDDLFDVVAGRSGIGWLAKLPAKELNALGRTLADTAQRYDHMILDTGAGVGRIVRKMTGNAGVVLLLINADPTSIVDTYVSLKVALAGRPASDVRIVVNAADSLRDGIKTYEALRRACEGFLGKSPPLAGVIRYDPCVPEAIRQQASLLDVYPASMAATDVQVIARRLVETV
ncbi:MAG: AAA family ATPase [Alphaproteobacteria bacterium]|nr:AAA family ATPase [Alphaproteobacteria bacterium]